MKTKLDLFNSARAAALSLIASTPPGMLLDAARALFKSEGWDENDWAYWHSNFTMQRNHAQGLSTQQLDSVVLAKQAALKKPAPPAPAAPVVAEKPVETSTAEPK